MGSRWESARRSQAKQAKDRAARRAENKTSAAPQNSNPFGENFQPFLIPETAPIRSIIGKPDPERVNAPQQNSNPFAGGFTPFMVPDTAPIRKLGGSKQEAPVAEDSGMTNNTGVTPVVPEGGTSPSFRTAVEQSDVGSSVPSSGNAGSGIDMSTGSRSAPPRDRMANASAMERYKVWVEANPTLAQRVRPGSAGYDEIQAILQGNESGKKPEEITQYGTEVMAAADDAQRSPGDMSKIMDGGLETTIDENYTIETPSTPETTSNPQNPQDGASAEPSLADNIRAVRMNRIESEQDEKLSNFYKNRTHKDVFDKATQKWKQVPINK